MRCGQCIITRGPSSAARRRSGTHTSPTCGTTKPRGSISRGGVDVMRKANRCGACTPLGRRGEAGQPGGPGSQEAATSASQAAAIIVDRDGAIKSALVEIPHSPTEKSGGGSRKPTDRGRRIATALTKQEPAEGSRIRRATRKGAAARAPERAQDIHAQAPSSAVQHRRTAKYPEEKIS